MKKNNHSYDYWLDLKKASKYTSLSIPTLRNLIYRSTLKHSTSTGKILIKKSWIDSFLEGDHHGC